MAEINIFCSIIERLSNNFHLYSVLFYLFYLLVSTFNLFLSFLLLLLLLLFPFAKFDRGNPFVSLASLSHWLFPHGRANFDESLTSYSFHGLIWFYRRINSLTRRDFRYARDDDIRSRIFPIVPHFHRILIIGENESIVGLSNVDRKNYLKI